METIKNFFSSAGQLVVDMFSAIGGFFKNVFSGSSAASAPAGGETKPAETAAPQEPAAAVALKALVSDADRAAIKGALDSTKHSFKEADATWLPPMLKDLARTEHSLHPEIGSDALPIFTQNEQGRLVVNLPQNARFEVRKMETDVSMPGQDVRYNVVVAPSLPEIGGTKNPDIFKPASFTAQSVTITGDMLEKAQMIIKAPKFGENSIYVEKQSLAKDTTLVMQSEGAKIGIVRGVSYLLNGEFNENPKEPPKPAVQQVQQPMVVYVQAPQNDNARDRHRETASARRSHSSSWSGSSYSRPSYSSGRTPIMNSMYYSRHPNLLFPRGYGF